VTWVRRGLIRPPVNTIEKEEARYFVYLQDAKQVPKVAPEDPQRVYGRSVDQMLQLQEHAVCVCGLKSNPKARLVIDMAAAQYGCHRRDVPGLVYPCAVFTMDQRPSYFPKEELKVDMDLWMIQLREMWRRGIGSNSKEVQEMYNNIMLDAETKLAKYLLATTPVVFL
jgi:hypothetical protein